MEYNQTNQPTQPYSNGQMSLPNDVLILIMGIVSIVICQPVGIAAWIMGNNSLAIYDQNPGQYNASSASMVRAGKICGIIGVALMVLAAILLMAGVSFFSFLQLRD